MESRFNNSHKLPKCLHKLCIQCIHNHLLSRFTGKTHLTNLAIRTESTDGWSFSTIYEIIYSNQQRNINSHDKFRIILKQYSSCVNQTWDKITWCGVFPSLRCYKHTYCTQPVWFLKMNYPKRNVKLFRYKSVHLWPSWLNSYKLFIYWGANTFNL